MNAPRNRLAHATEYADRLAAGQMPHVVLDGVADAVVVTDARLDAPGPTITYANPAFERLTGYACSELVGNNPRMLQGCDTDVVELARMKATLLAGELFEGNVLNYGKSRLEYVVGWAVVPIKAVNGDVDGWLSIQNDVLADARMARSGR